MITVCYMKAVFQYRKRALVDDAELSVIKTLSDVVLICKPI